MKLSPDRLKRVEGNLCGALQTTRRIEWTPGLMLKGGYFISFNRYASHLGRQARKARGAKAKRFKRSARRYRLLARRATCAVRAPVAPGGAAVTPTSYPTPTPTPVTPLRFDVNGAAALALRDPNTARAARSGTTTGSNLTTVSSSGQTRDAAVSGSAPISRFLIAPGERVYVLFQYPVNLANTSSYSGPRCLLAEIRASSTDPVCIDSSLTSISIDASRNGNDFVQFDAAGAIYYAGRTAQTMVLRRYHDGVVSDLINDNIYLMDFLVRPDGSVFVTGSSSTGASWLRRITPAGGVQSLHTASSLFLRAFPDGNVYYGITPQNGWGVRRFLTQSSAVDPSYWIGRSSSEQTPHFDIQAMCENSDGFSGFCGSSGASVLNTFTTSDGKLFAIAGHAGDGRMLQYFPALEVAPTRVRKVTVAQGVLTHLLLAGFDAAERNVLTVLNTTNGEETLLNGAENEIEIYHLDYSARTNKVMFDGLRFADNKYVLGTVDMATKQVSVTPTNTLRWADFQTFG